MANKQTETTTQLKPPYGNVAWYEKFFELIRTRSFDKFDKEIIELNIVRGRNATMLFNGLRFLGLVEDSGKVTDRFESLRRRGDEFKQNLKTVVQDAYSQLFSKVVVSKASPETLFNYLAEYYDYGEATASLSSKIFRYLCQEAGIELSPELAEGEFKVKRRAQVRKKREPKERKERREARERVLGVPEDMHVSRWGNDIVMYLRKGDRKTRDRIAKNAKILIDMYVEEASAEEERQ